MNITLTGTKITQDTKFLAFEKNSNVDVINITVDTDNEWAYKLDVRYPEKYCVGGGKPLYNIINLTRNGNICTAILTSDMLPFSGKYVMQLRAINGDKVAHSDTFDAWVKYSIEPGETYDPVPSEFYQIEQNIIEMNNNPPYPSDDGYWMIWDTATHAYKKSDIKATDGLPEISNDTKGKMLTNDGTKAEWGGAVRYDINQGLNEDDKFKARRNIGAFPTTKLYYFYDKNAGSKHNNDICAARQYDVIFPGNIYSTENISNEGMTFPAYVVSVDNIAINTDEVRLLDAKGVAWKVITSTVNVYMIERLTNYTLYVNITETEDSDGNITYNADYTYDEIKVAYEAGNYVCAVYNGVIFSLVALNVDGIIFYVLDYFHDVSVGTISNALVVISSRNVIGVIDDQYDIPQYYQVYANQVNNVIDVNTDIQSIGNMAMNDMLNPIIVYYPYDGASSSFYHLINIYEVGSGKYRVTFVNTSSNSDALFGTNESGSDVWTNGTVSNFMTYTMTKNGDDYVLRDQSNAVIKPNAVYARNCVIEYNYKLYYPQSYLSSLYPVFMAYNENLSKYSQISIDRRSNSITFTDWQSIPNTLPVASDSTLGGVKPVAKTDNMTQDVGVDADGKLWTQPGGGSSGGTWTLHQKIKTAEAVVLMEISLPDDITDIILRVYQEDDGALFMTDSDGNAPEKQHNLVATFGTAKDTTNAIANITFPNNGTNYHGAISQATIFDREKKLYVSQSGMFARRSNGGSGSVSMLTRQDGDNTAPDLEKLTISFDSTAVYFGVGTVAEVWTR